MSSKRSEVLIDVTALRALSGLRGIGRYIRDLLVGLSEVAGTEAPDLTISAATHLGPAGLRVTRDLRAAAEDSVAEANTASGALLSYRRALLGPLTLAHRADLLHTPEARGTPLPPRVPQLVTCYDLIPLRYPRHYLGWRRDDGTFAAPMPSYAWLYLKDLRRYRTARRVVCISERSRQDVLELLRVPADRVDAVPTGLSLERYTSEPAEALPQRPRPFALYVGYADYRKNIPNLFEAIRLANETRPLDLLWAGDIRGDDLVRMRLLAEEKRVAHLVHFLGFVKDEHLVALYRQAVALAFLSRLEGYGLPVLEAMAAGCATVVASGSSSDEICAETGIIVSPDDPAAAAGALLSLQADPVLRRKLGDAGRERAKLFTCARMARGYLDSYRKALTTSSA